MEIQTWRTVGFASRYVTTTRVPTQRRARASCSRSRTGDGAADDGHATAPANFFP